MALRHKWGNPTRPDQTTTFRACEKCGLVKVTRHEPDNNPPHWIEWERDGRKIISATTPICEEAMKADVETKKDYRLIELTASNFLILKAVTIRPDRAVYRINGQNAQGKSSVLNIISAAIGGTKLCPKQAIRKGQTEAMVSVDFGALRATRRFRLKDDGSETSDLTVEFANGKRPKSPQDVLNELRGSPIADDPLEFARLKPKDRYELLKQLVPDFDFDEHAQKYDDLFTERTETGREFERAKGAAASIVVPPDAPLAPMDISDLGRQLSEAISFNADIDARAARREGFADELENMRDRADKMAAELKALYRDITAREKKIEEAEKLPAKVDIDSLQQKIASAETVNAGARKRADKLAREAEAKALSDKYDAQTTSLKALDDAKAKAIETAKLPVPEITFGKSDILLDGLPFDQASTARKIRVSTALLMALKPDLRVLLVRQGSLLDDEARAALETDAEKHGFVVLMETVGAGDGTGVTIQDGEVV